MKYIIIFAILLTGCSVKFDSTYEEELATKYNKGWELGYEVCKNQLKEEAPPANKFYYRQQVRVINGFYKGTVGRVVDIDPGYCNKTNRYTVWVKPDEAYNFCEKDLGAIK